MLLMLLIVLLVALNAACILGVYVLVDHVNRMRIELAYLNAQIYDFISHKGDSEGESQDVEDARQMSFDFGEVNESNS